MSKNDIARDIISKINELFKTSEGFKLRVLPSHPHVDLELEVSYGDKTTILLVEVKSVGQPRYLRESVYKLKKLFESTPNAYGIIGAPYISNQGVDLLKENDIGYVDLSGNAYINTGLIYIRIAGNPNEYPATRQLKTLFAPKTTRIIRVLLNNPSKWWYVQELADKTSLSLGQTSNVKHKLLLEEFAVENNRRFRINNPEKLLDLWAEHYSYRDNGVKNYYSLLPLKEVENKIARYCEARNLRHALTMFSGASRLVPFTRYLRSFIYVSGIDDTDMADYVGLKNVEEGANVTLLTPYDDGIYDAVQRIDDVCIVDNIQLYLDLISFKGRGFEQAEILRRQVIGY